MMRRFLLCVGLRLFTSFLLLSACVGDRRAEHRDARPVAQEAAEKVKHPGFKAQELFDSVEANDADRVWNLIDQGADLNAKSNVGETPLIFAVRRNLRNIVRLLLEAGVAMEVRDDEGYTALLAAADDRRARLTPESIEPAAECLEALIDAGADVGAKTDAGLTPLMIADLKKSRRLLDAGALIDEVDLEGQTALIHAAQLAWVDKVKLLLARGANAELMDKSGLTARGHVARALEDGRQAVPYLWPGAPSDEEVEATAVALGMETTP